MAVSEHKETIMTRDQILDLLLKAAQTVERMDADINAKYGAGGLTYTTQVIPWEVRQHAQEPLNLTWYDVLVALKSPQTPSKEASEGHRLA